MDEFKNDFYVKKVKTENYRFLILEYWYDPREKEYSSLLLRPDRQIYGRGLVCGELDGYQDLGKLIADTHGYVDNL